MTRNWKVILSTTALFLCMENTIESMEDRGNEPKKTRKKNKTKQTEKQSEILQDDSGFLKEIKQNIGNENNIYGKFNRQPVKGKEENHKEYDHQGHIIPQNMLAHMLLADHKKFLEMTKEIEEQYKESDKQELTGILLKQLPMLIEKHWNDFNFSHFLDYHPDLLNIDGGPSEILSKIYSKIIWNPGNICRAPGDTSRPKNEPGEAIDNTVLEALHHTNVHMYELLNEAKGALEKGDVVSFMKLWRTVLSAFNENGENGYYRFNWKLDKEKFIPDVNTKN